MHNFTFLSWIKVKVHSSAKGRVCQYTFIGFYPKAYKEKERYPFNIGLHHINNYHHKTKFFLQQQMF